MNHAGTASETVTDATAPAAGRTTPVAVLGGSGYTGGEALRLLLQHPGFEVAAATSSQLSGKPLHRAHPNLRGATDLRFTPHDALGDADAVLACVPHGRALEVVPELLESGVRVVDLSADFRLRDPAAYRRAYGTEHPRADLLAEAVYGLAETQRDRIPGARLVSGVGCLATSMNLALLPLARAGLLEGATVVADVKVGSSAAGVDAGPGAAHAERSRALRLYAPTGHRHAEEVVQETGGGFHLHVSAHAVELVRGILATCHVLLPEAGPDEKECWRLWRSATADEPFLRIVNERQGIHRVPDPKLVAGSNYADLGFHVEEGGRRIVATCAIDNLVKGAAGSAVQSLNLMHGRPESEGLTQLPLHPA